ncbi:DUF2285 domain-containing protein [Pigmentiphaga sp.]|uniref:DNA -binding domain-containing protein n=1 Tax=Pigmentiphaga sp. TaxID=1977564 RepID=UPI0025E80B74|nr:DUF2285 domain-containing protein [Pigmentiphaga sp.]
MRPLWRLSSTDAWLHVRAASVHDPDRLDDFDLWRVPGRKRLVHAGGRLVLTTEHGPHHARATVAADLAPGSPYGFVIPLDGHLRTRLPHYQADARFIEGDVPAAAFRPASRSDLMHLHALQALDALLAHAHHRDIAIALFGEDAVHARWTRDGELRAQLRHVLVRAEGLMRCDYLRLAGVRLARVPLRCCVGGDEPAH